MTGYKHSFPFYGSLAYDNGMGPHYWERESQENQCCSEGMGIPSSLQGRLLPEDIEPTSIGVKADVSCFSKKNDELRALLMVGGARRELMKRWSAVEVI